MTTTHSDAGNSDPLSTWTALAATTAAALTAQGYARWTPAATSSALARFGPTRAGDWTDFAASWHRLVRDAYMGDGGRYRFRRHATYAWPAHGVLRLAPHQAHYQARDYNALNGGVERWFEAIEAPLAGGAVLRALISAGHDLVAGLRPGAGWHIETHQFRITAEAHSKGRPTPEGVHRDGVDYVMVMMVHRENIASGRTELYDRDGAAVAGFTLTDPAELVMLDDERLAHGVTPVTPLEPGRPSYRDVLVVTFRVAGSAAQQGS